MFGLDLPTLTTLPLDNLSAPWTLCHKADHFFDCLWIQLYLTVLG